MFLNKSWLTSEWTHIKIETPSRPLTYHKIVLRGASLSTFEIFDVARGQKRAFCNFGYWELSKYFLTYFQKPTRFYLLTTKANLMGKTFLWCERPWTTLTEIVALLICSSVRNWLDNPLNAADIDHVEFRVCLVSEPLDRVVFSNFLTQREMFYFTVVFKMKKEICLIPVFFFTLLWIIKLRVNNTCFSLRLRQITQTLVVIFHDIDHAEFKDCLVSVYCSQTFAHSERNVLFCSCFKNVS